MRIIAALVFLSSPVMGLPIDSTGWTVITPNEDSRMVYVSSSTGNDTNDGLSANTPVRTLDRGQALLRDGFPDHLLLRCGDIWANESFRDWRISGRSETERAVLSSYGTGPRPRVQPPANQSAWACTRGQSHLAIIGIEFYFARRDPQHSAYVAGSSGMGIDYRVPGGINTNRANLLIEDVLIRFAASNSIQSRNGVSLENLEIRRSLFLDNYGAPGVHSQGMFFYGIDGILLEENLFDHNGWYGNRDTGGAVGSPGQATGFNHNLYVDNENPLPAANPPDQTDKIVILGNIVARGSSHGIQLRCGGTLRDNLFVRNAISVLIGGGDYTELYQPQGVDSVCHLNIISEGTDIRSDLERGTGLSGFNLRNLDCRFNVVSDIVSGPVNTFGMRFGGEHAANPTLQLEKNICFEWRRGAPELSGTMRAPIQMEEENCYWDAAGVPWTITGTNQKSEDVPFPAPSRTVALYNGYLGSEPTFDAFMAEARQQSKATWRTQYTAAAVNEWIRAGYAGEETDYPEISGNVLANDTDADGDELHVAMVNNDSSLVGTAVKSSLGQIVIASDGEYTYTFTGQKTDQAQTDQFTYRCSDGTDPSNETTITITIPADITPNTPPVANPDLNTIP